MIFRNKNILVSGVAKSGISSAILLNRLGAFVTIQDLKNENELDNEIKEEIKKLRKKGVNLFFGKNPDEIVQNQDLIILSPGIPTDLTFCKKAYELSIPIWSEIELGYRLCKSNIIGITGTNGKTTTTSLLGHIIKNYLPLSQIVGNIGIPFTQNVLETKKEGWVIAELSSFQLETIHSFKPKISIVLNITPDHLNRHKTIENYIKAKERIFENQTSEDFLILNYDDEVCAKMKEKTKSKVIFFSSSKTIKEGIYSDDKSIYLNFKGNDEKVIDIKELKILGKHNVENAMAAVAGALCAGVPIDIIRKSLKEFKAVEHRIEYVTTINNIEFYNDSKGTNPDAAIKSIEAMKRPIILIGGGYDKGSDFTQWIQKFQGKVKHLVVIGEVKDKIIETAEKFNFKNYTKADTFEQAVNICYEKAQAGDCVLLSPACASWDMFKSYEQRGDLFKEIVFNLGR